jgi:hypothetical protein
MIASEPTVGRILSATVVASACAMALLASGCGPAKGSLSGKATLDGTPLKGGRINFISDSSGPGATAEIGDDGTYSIPVLSAGTYSVTVDTEYLKSAGGSTGSGGGRPGMGSGGPGSGPPPGVKGAAPPKDAGKAPPKMDVPEGYKMASPGDAAKKYVKIPAKYGDASQSGLTYTFTGGSQTYDIPLSGK